jgi:hypothetical protein
LIDAAQGSAFDALPTLQCSTQKSRVTPAFLRRKSLPFVSPESLMASDTLVALARRGYGSAKVSGAASAIELLDQAAQ